MTSAIGSWGGGRMYLHKKAIILAVVSTLFAPQSLASDAISRRSAEELAAKYFSIATQLRIANSLGKSGTEAKSSVVTTIEDIASAPLKPRLLHWLDETSFQSDGFQTFISQNHPMHPARFVLMKRIAPDKVRVEFEIDTYETYGLTSNLESTKGFVEKYRVSNVRQDELEAAFANASVPEIIELRVEAVRTVAFEIVTRGCESRIVEVQNVPKRSKLTITAP